MRLAIGLVVAALALPLQGCEESTFCGVPVLTFLFCDPNANSPAPPTFDTNDDPVASFIASPSAPAVGAQVTFSNTSHDPDGVLPGLQSIDESEWDLDGDGTFETSGDPRWTSRGYRDDVVHSYATAGPRNVGLLVRDWDGAATVVTRTINVGGSTSSPTPQPAGQASAPDARPAATRPPHGLVARLVLRRISAARARRTARSLRGLIVRGRLRGFVSPVAADPGQAPPRPPRALIGLLVAPVTARVDIVTNSARSRQTISTTALSLLPGPPKGRLCFRLRLTNRDGRQPAGTLRLLGGTGTGARLHGTARVRGELRSARVAVVGGTMQARTGARRGLPPICRGLAGRRP